MLVENRLTRQCLADTPGRWQHLGAATANGVLSLPHLAIAGREMKA